MELIARFRMYDVIRPTKAGTEYYNGTNWKDIDVNGSEIIDLVTHGIPEEGNPEYAYQEFKLKDLPRYWFKSEEYGVPSKQLFELVKRENCQQSEFFD